MNREETSAPLLFIELYSYKPTWWQLSASQRTEVAEKVIESIKGLDTVGVTVLGYGANDQDTSKRAPHDFFAVYQVPDLATQQAFEKQIQASGWYDVFEQVNVRGAQTHYSAALLAHVSDTRKSR